MKRAITVSFIFLFILCMHRTAHAQSDALLEYNRRIAVLANMLVQEVTVGGSANQIIPELPTTDHPQPGYGPRANIITTRLYSELQERANVLPIVIANNYESGSEAPAASLLPISEAEYYLLCANINSATSLSTADMHDDAKHTHAVLRSVDPQFHTRQAEMMRNMFDQIADGVFLASLGRGSPPKTTVVNSNQSAVELAPAPTQEKLPIVLLWAICIIGIVLITMLLVDSRRQQREIRRVGQKAEDQISALNKVRDQLEIARLLSQNAMLVEKIFEKEAETEAFKEVLVKAYQNLNQNKEQTDAEPNGSEAPPTTRKRQDTPVSLSFTSLGNGNTNPPNNK